MSLSAGKFIRRFLRHVLPFAYQRVRYWGLYAGWKGGSSALEYHR